MRNVQSEISELLSKNRVVLFMKGSKAMPQCGFSATAVQILSQYTPDFLTVDVLKDMDVRQGIKDFSSWPTIPQLYIGGKFVGGSDIMRELHGSGELQKLITP